MLILFFNSVLFEYNFLCNDLLSKIFSLFVSRCVRKFKVMIKQKMIKPNLIS